MRLSHLNYAIWILTTALEVLVCALAYARGLYRRLPLFTAYLTALAISEVLAWAAYRAFGFASWPAYYAAWGLHAILLAALGLAIAELCSCLLRGYPGIWRLAWRILLAVTFVFLVFAAIESASRPYWLGTFVLALQKDLELTATGILIALLLIGRYYTLAMDRLERRIAAGLCFSSMVVVMTNAVMVQGMASHLMSRPIYAAWLSHSQVWWNSAQGVASACVLVLWAVALRQPIPADRPVPVLLPASTYRELSPAVNFRLRAMNARLTELLKS